MTDWLRVIGYTVLGVVIAIGLLATGWIVWSRRQLNQFRFTDDQTKAMQDSQRGRRPMWLQDQHENDSSRVDSVPRSVHGDLPRRATGDKRT